MELYSNQQYMTQPKGTASFTNIDTKDNTLKLPLTIEHALSQFFTWKTQIMGHFDADQKHTLYHRPISRGMLFFFGTTTAGKACDEAHLLMVVDQKQKTLREMGNKMTLSVTKNKDTQIPLTIEHVPKHLFAWKTQKIDHLYTDYKHSLYQRSMTWGMLFSSVKKREQIKDRHSLYRRKNRNTPLTIPIVLGQYGTG